MSTPTRYANDTRLVLDLIAYHILSSDEIPLEILAPSGSPLPDDLRDRLPDLRPELTRKSGKEVAKLRVVLFEEHDPRDWTELPEECVRILVAIRNAQSHKALTGRSDPLLTKGQVSKGLGSQWQIVETTGLFGPTWVAYTLLSILCRSLGIHPWAVFLQDRALMRAICRRWERPYSGFLILEARRT